MGLTMNGWCHGKDQDRACLLLEGKVMEHIHKKHKHAAIFA